MFLATSIRYAALPLTSDKGVKSLSRTEHAFRQFLLEKTFPFKKRSAFNALAGTAAIPPYARRISRQMLPFKFTREAKDTELMSIFLRLDCLWAK